MWNKIRLYHIVKFTPYFGAFGLKKCIKNFNPYKINHLSNCAKIKIANMGKTKKLIKISIKTKPFQVVYMLP